VSSAFCKLHSFPPSSSLFGTRPGVVATIPYSFVIFTRCNTLSCALVHNTNLIPSVVTQPSHRYRPVSSSPAAITTINRHDSRPCSRHDPSFLLFSYFSYCLEHLYSTTRLATYTSRCTYLPTAASTIRPLNTAISEVRKQHVHNIS
jgi:hypothetical protein